MQQLRIPAVFMRGGTSKAVIFRQEHLPEDRSAWPAIFLAVMGSPDPYGRQLDGMGGGISSLSKVCVVAPPSRPDADVDFTFAQVSVADRIVDFTGNCGNMTSAIGPFAVDERLVVPEQATGEIAVRIHNTNTKKIIRSRFPVIDGLAAVNGDLAIDGVAGTGASVCLDFLNPGGARTGKLLPTARSIDTLTLRDGSVVEASLVDASNPSVFVRADDLGLTGAEAPDFLERNVTVMRRLEEIRCAGAVAMGIAKDAVDAARAVAQPKVAMVSAPRDSSTLTGGTLLERDHDIAIRMISIGRPHRAVPLTGALCLAAACYVPGSIPNRLLGAPGAAPGALRIGHPSGTILVSARREGDHIESVSVYRTARRLFEGFALYKSRS
jgi:2-methylaconitate cis-trans-isomerase PrpF